MNEVVSLKSQKNKNEILEKPNEENLKLSETADEFLSLEKVII